VIRAYGELEIRGVLETEQGTGNFHQSTKGTGATTPSGSAALNQLIGDFIARAGFRGIHSRRTYRATASDAK